MFSLGGGWLTHCIAYWWSNIGEWSSIMDQHAIIQISNFLPYAYIHTYIHRSKSCHIVPIGAYH